MFPAIINSLPKSGTNLLAKCLILFGYEEKGLIGASSILNVGIKSFLCRYSHIPFRAGYIIGIDSPVEIPKFIVNRQLKSLKNGEFLNAHVGYTTDLYREILSCNIRPVVMIRDPRAVIASLVPYILGTKRHHANSLFKSLRNEERYRVTLHGYSDGKVSIQSLLARCLALETWIEDKQALVIKFEDLIGEKGGGEDDLQKRTLLSLCNHLGAPIDKVGYVQSNLFGDTGRTFRKGEINSWKEEIPESVQRELDQTIGLIIKKWGYGVNE